MNKLFFMGRVTKDIPEEDVIYTSGDNPTCIAHFNIAVDRRYKKNNEDTSADFFRITTFGKTAEFAKNYLKKGTKIVIEGRIENNNYTDTNGNKVFRDQIIADNIEFAESKKAAADANGSGGTKVDDKGFIDVPDGLESELPFR